MLDNLQPLSLINGISGREENVREMIIGMLGENTEFRVDAMGNLLVEMKGKKRAKNRVMLAAHMDEVGMIVTDITPSGFLRFANVGGIDISVMLGKYVVVGDKQLPGVIGVTPVHLLKGDKLKKLPEPDSLYIDVGASSAEDLKGFVKPGDKICFESKYLEFGNGYIASKALDDRAGCAVLLELLNGTPEYDLTCAFTVQEEVGLRGAAAAAYGLKAEYAVVVETTTAADISGVDGEKQVCTLGGGGVVPFMDRTTVYDRELFKKAFEIAEGNGIPIQTKTLVAGGNDAGAIHKSGTGVKTLTVSFACRYLHSPSCVIKKDDIEPVCKLVGKLAEVFAIA